MNNTDRVSDATKLKTAKNKWASKVIPDSDNAMKEVNSELFRVAQESGVERMLQIRP